MPYTHKPKINGYFGEKRFISLLNMLSSGHVNMLCFLWEKSVSRVYTFEYKPS